MRLATAYSKAAASAPVR